MTQIQGELRPTGPVLVVISRYNERITARLLDGALSCCRDAGLEEGATDVVWVPGAFELGAAAAAGAGTGRYSAIVALGAVIRGETPHFEYVAGEAARGCGQVAVQYRIPVGFGVLTTDTAEQALARAGGEAGNKGYEAADAAIRAADALAQLRKRHASS
jgi:6,7-dimethyl-8-ribityllumazine synthase